MPLTRGRFLPADCGRDCRAGSGAAFAVATDIAAAEAITRSSRYLPTSSGPSWVLNRRCPKRGELITYSRQEVGRQATAQELCSLFHEMMRGFF